MHQLFPSGQKSSKGFQKTKDETYEQYVRRKFPHIATFGFAERHIRLGRWFGSLRRGIRLAAMVEVWGRGGAKSSSAELGVSFIGDRPEDELPCRFVLYISAKQDQANLHVQSISTNFSDSGVERSLGRYGHSKGWTLSRLRCANGFNVQALGLDAAARGIKLDEFRPDLIIFDDIDEESDTPETTAKKIRTITSKILPSGSSDCKILFIQNLIIDTGIVSQLVKGTAGFLLDANIAPIEPAVRGLEVEQYVNDEGKTLWRITAGKATWEGQNLSTCEAQINDWGIKAFRREALHEVEDPDDLKLFKPWMFEDRIIDPATVPSLKQWYRGWDTATGEDEVHDWSATSKIAYDEFGNLYIRGFNEKKFNPREFLNWAEPIVDSEPTVYQIAEGHNMGYGLYGYLQRKGGAWKLLAKIQPITAKQGGKRKRAASLALMANDRKVYIVREGAWESFLDELYNFTGIKDNNEKDNLVDSVTTPMTYLKENKSTTEKTDVNTNEKSQRVSKALSGLK